MYGNLEGLLEMSCLPIGCGGGRNCICGRGVLPIFDISVARFGLLEFIITGAVVGGVGNKPPEIGTGTNPVGFVGGIDLPPSAVIFRITEVGVNAILETGVALRFVMSF